MVWREMVLLDSMFNVFIFFLFLCFVVWLLELFPVSEGKHCLESVRIE